MASCYYKRPSARRVRVAPLRQGIIQVAVAGVGCNAWRSELTSCYNQQYMGRQSNDTIASFQAFVRLEPYTLNGVRTVRRRPGGRETTHVLA